MDSKIIEKIIQGMKYELNEEQLQKLTKVCYEAFLESSQQKHVNHIEKFLNSKKIEGCSKRTIHSYFQVLNFFEKNINISLCAATTDTIRTFLTSYQQRNKCSNVTLDTIRRILSSFFQMVRK